MGRAKLQPGKLGKVTTKRLGHERYEARARLRKFNGEMTQVKAYGERAEVARQNLREHARTKAYAGMPGSITVETTLTELVDRTLEHLRSLPSTEIRPQTVDGYETIKPILAGTNKRYTGIGSLTLGEVTTPSVIHNWLYSVSMVSHANAHRCRVVLSHAFNRAIKAGVTPWGLGNPASEAELHPAQEKAVKAPTVEEIQGVRAAVKAWQTPYKRTDLVGIVELITATGARPNEVLALRWEDIDLSVTPATVTISGTLVEVKGEGIMRQPAPKTNAGFRVLSLPSWATARLMEMRVSATNEKVFPNENGGWLMRRNIATIFRAARGDAYKHITLYSYRRAVATMLDRALGVDKAAKQLGHSSPAITGRHYVERAAVAGDYTAVLEGLAPE